LVPPPLLLPAIVTVAPVPACTSPGRERASWLTAPRDPVTAVRADAPVARMAWKEVTAKSVRAASTSLVKAARVAAVDRTGAPEGNAPAAALARLWAAASMAEFSWEAARAASAGESPASTITLASTLALAETGLARAAFPSVPARTKKPTSSDPRLWRRRESMDVGIVFLSLRRSGERNGLDCRGEGTGPGRLNRERSRSPDFLRSNFGSRTESRWCQLRCRVCPAPKPKGDKAPAANQCPAVKPRPRDIPGG